MRPPQIQNPTYQDNERCHADTRPQHPLIARSIFRSVSDATRSQPSRGSAVDYFHAQRDNDYRENHSEDGYAQPDQYARPRKRACQHSQHDRRR